MTPRAAFHITRIGKRNQVTIPAEMLRKLGLAPGDRVGVVLEDDTILVEKSPDPFEALARFRAELALGPFSNDEIEEMIAEAREERADRLLHELADESSRE